MNIETNYNLYGINIVKSSRNFGIPYIFIANWNKDDHFLWPTYEENKEQGILGCTCGFREILSNIEENPNLNDLHIQIYRLCIL